MNLNIRSWSSVLLHPLSLAIPVFAVILLVSELSIAPYRLSVEGLERQILPMEDRLDPQRSGKRVSYVDVDADSLNDFILAYNLPTNATVTAQTQSKKFLEVWNLPGYWYGAPELWIEDYYGDGMQDLFALTIQAGDSLFVHHQLLRKEDQGLSSKYVCQVRPNNGVYETVQQILGFLDMTGDGQEELIFCLNAGFTLQPRAIYAWDLVHDTLLRSEEAGLNGKYNRQLIHARSTQGRENLLFGTSIATDNNDLPIPYADTGSYAVVYKTGLRYLFEPLCLGGPQSRTAAYPHDHQGDQQILCICNDPRKDRYRTGFFFLDYSGNLLDSVHTELYDLDRLNNLEFNGNILVYQTGSEKFRTGILSDDLEFKVKFSSSESFAHLYSMNLDRDSLDEVILLNRTGSVLAILQDDLKEAVEIQIPEIIPSDAQFSVMNLDGRRTSLSVYSTLASFTLNYDQNRWYPFRFFLFALAYAAVVGFMYLLKHVFMLSVNRRLDREKELLHYQWQTVMNQLNPHFTFNAINSIGDAVLEGRNVEAYNYFTKLSQLIRKSMTHAMRPYRSLGEEIGFVREYLEIEKYRFGDKLEFSIETEPSVNLDLPVPHMLIHIFVENALKHGIFHLEKDGRVAVNVKKSGRGAEIVIKDNGVGFERAYEIEKEKGSGLQLIDNYLKIYNSTESHRISYHISTQPDEVYTGTQVLIRME